MTDAQLQKVTTSVAFTYSCLADIGRFRTGVGHAAESGLSLRAYAGQPETAGRGLLPAE